MGWRDDGRISRTSALVLLALLAVIVFVAPTFPLIVFAGVLVGVFLQGLSDQLAKRTPLPYTAALTIVIVVLVAVATVGAVLLAPGIARDLDRLQEAVPELIRSGRGWLEDRGWGRTLLQRLQRAGDEQGGDIALQVGVLGGGVVDAVVYVVVVVIAGTFLASDPGLYVRGLVLLSPPAYRARAAEVFHAIGSTLRRFLLGRIASMVFVGTGSAILLAVLGVPLGVPVGLLAGALTFVPYLGPLAGGVPVLFVALVQGPATLVWALGIYTVIQLVEGFILTPLVQERVVSLPAAVTLASEVGMGLLFGPLGVVIAMPFAASVLVSVRLLWVEPTTRERAGGPAGKAPARA